MRITNTQTKSSKEITERQMLIFSYLLYRSTQSADDKGYFHLTYENLASVMEWSMSTVWRDIALLKSTGLISWNKKDIESDYKVEIEHIPSVPLSEEETNILLSILCHNDNVTYTPRATKQTKFTGTPPKMGVFRILI